MDDPTYDRLHDETLPGLLEHAPVDSDPRLSRRRLLGGATGGFVLAASGLLVPEGVTGVERKRPVERILNDPRERNRKNRNRKDRNRKNRNDKDRNRKDRQGVTAPGPYGNRLIQFDIYNRAWGNNVLLEAYWPKEGASRPSWIKVADTNLNQGTQFARFEGHSLDPNQNVRDWGQAPQLRVDVNGMGVWAKNPNAGKPEAGFLFGAQTKRSLDIGENVMLRLPGTNRAIKVTRKDDTKDFKVFAVELITVPGLKLFQFHVFNHPQAGWGDVTLETYWPDYSRASQDTYTWVKQESKTLPPGPSTGAQFVGHSLVGGQLDDNYYALRQFRLDINGSGVWARSSAKVGDADLVQAGFLFGPAELYKMFNRGDTAFRVLPGTNRAIQMTRREDANGFAVLAVDLIGIDLAGSSGGTKDK